MRNVLSMFARGRGCLVMTNQPYHPTCDAMDVVFETKIQLVNLGAVYTAMANSHGGSRGNACGVRCMIAMLSASVRMQINAKSKTDDQ